MTGGLGFIGSNFIWHWLRNNRNDSIVNVDKITYAADPRYLSGVEKEFEYKFIRGDIRSREVIQSAVEDADAIVNFAAESHVDRSIEDSDEFVSSNYLAVKNMLDLIKGTDIRLHQVSTDEVFGSLTYNKKTQFRHLSRYDPRNPYSATKAAADLMIGAYVNTYGVNSTISYSGNNYGPFQHPEKLIPKTIFLSMLDRKIPVYGNGRQMRDWVYVEDHCAAISLILKRGRAGERFLVGSGKAISNVELVRRILRLLGREDDLIEYVADRPGHDSRYCSDYSYIEKKLGWKPEIDLEKGLRKTIEHYSTNPELYRDKIARATKP